MTTVNIGGKEVGHDKPVFFIAEIGINHNGDVEIAKRLIDAALLAGCDAVKFQKRTVDTVYTKEELLKPRENPFGPTNGDLKRGLEFGLNEYLEIDDYCKERGMIWLASPWDEASVDFLEAFNSPCYKVASASLTDDNLLRHIKSKDKPVILSTGMSDLNMIKHAVDVLGVRNLIIMHATSTYPSKPEELNLSAILTLRNEFSGVPIGYSGHEVGISPTFAAVVLGACIVERHITLDRAMWGSDHAASVEPHGVKSLVSYIKAWEEAKGDGVIKIYDSEKPIIEKLRRVNGVSSVFETL